MKLKSIFYPIITVIVLFSTTFLNTVQAAAIVPASVPLFQSRAVKPNIMLLFDTSGSMDTNDVGSLFYDATYLALTNPSASSWAYCSAVDSSNACKTWSSFPPSNLKDSLTGLPLLNDSTMKRAECGAADQSKWVQLRKLPLTSGSTKYCVRLDPVSDLVSWKYNGLYLRWLFDKYATTGGKDLRSSTGVKNPETRLSVAKDAVLDILDLEGARFGLATFNNQSGSKMVRNCNDTAAHITDLKTTVTNLNTDSWTPLAEAYYEVTRFFRGLTPYYSSSVHNSSTISGGKFISPIQYECQKNIIITITDGFPTYDTNFPTDDPADVADSAHALPNWDGTNTADIKFGTSCTDPDSILFLPQSDGLGYQASGSTHGCTTIQDNETHSTFLDDMGAFGYDLDLKADSVLDLDGQPYTGKQNLLSYTVGLNIDNQMLSDTAVNGDGQYYYANDAAELKFALRNALRDVLAKVGSSSAVTTNSTRLDTDTFIFQAQFKGGEWSGDLRAFKIESNGSINSSVAWSTAESTGIFDAFADRKIFTSNTSGTGIDFTWANLTTAQKATFNNDPNTAAVDNDGLGQGRLDWLRGDFAKDGTVHPYGTGTPQAIFTFRERGKVGTLTNILGDIINSDPFFVGASNDYGYSILPNALDLDGNSILEFSTGASSYDSFVQANIAADDTSSYTNALYTAANDGMLHAFNAKTGKELFSYIPSTLIDRLPILTSSEYKHVYFNDGSPWVGHAYIGATEATRSWKNILIGSLGVGGKTLYALDVTNPSSFSTANIMWEFTSSDLGFSINNSTILPLANGEWGVIVANGIDNATNHAKLLILNIKTGAVISSLDTNPSNTATLGDSTTPNGLTSAFGVRDEDGIIRTVYGGDILGNIWRFNIADKNPANWGVAYSGKPVFTAKDSAGTAQNITAELDVAKSVTGGYLITFGTGKYLEIGDATVGTNPQINTFYGIRDTGSGNKTDASWTTIVRNDLVQQTMTEQTIAGKKYRNVSSNALTAANKGWYLDLKPATGSGIGERVVEAPILRNDRVIFVTLIPSTKVCLPGGTGWLMEINAQFGNQLIYPVLDTNGDKTVNTTDIPVSGAASDGILSTPAVISKGDEFKFSSSSDGSIKTFNEAGDKDSGRQSWRQLR